MTFHRLIQIIGPVAYWTWISLTFVSLKSETMSRWVPGLVRVLDDRPEVTLVVILALFALGLYLRPPAAYLTMNREQLQARHQTPLSRLFQRPGYLIFLEVVSWGLAAVISVGTVIYAGIHTLTRDSSLTVSMAPAWGIAGGCIFSHLSLRALRRYIYP